MKQYNIYPTYYDKFQCIAADCTDCCCAYWQVAIDNETALMYECVEGEMGERLRLSQTIDVDGDRVFRLKEDRCPFLEKSGLCEIQRRLGEEYLCATCYSYPRAVQEYSDFAEHDLSLSCPEAARLILSESVHSGYIEYLDEVPDYELLYTPEFMDMLRGTREILRRIICEPGFTTQRIVQECYEYSKLVQKNIKNRSYEIPEYIMMNRKVPEEISYVDLIDHFLSKEILTEEWREMLLDARKLGEKKLYYPEFNELRKLMVSFSNGYRRLFLYYIDRYWLRANIDCNVVGKIHKMVKAYIILRRLQTAYYVKNKELPFSASVRIVQLYSKEVEHSATSEYDFW